MFLPIATAPISLYAPSPIAIPSDHTIASLPITIDGCISSSEAPSVSYIAPLPAITLSSFFHLSNIGSVSSTDEPPLISISPSPRIDSPLMVLSIISPVSPLTEETFLISVIYSEYFLNVSDSNTSTSCVSIAVFIKSFVSRIYCNFSFIVQFAIIHNLFLHH